MEHRVSTTVAAPPEQIWPLFMDLERWPELTESITSLRRLDTGPLHIGSEAVIKQPRLPRARWRVTELNPGHSFIWQTKVGAVTSVGGHVITPQGQGSEIILTLSLHGPFARTTDALIGRLTERNLALELDGFRRAAESAPA